MKKICCFFLLIIILTGPGIFSSCKKTVTVLTLKSSTPLQALINSDTTLSVFYSLVEKAKDSTIFGGVDSSIVLIPTNTAFASAGINASNVNSIPASMADSIIRYYYIPAPVILMTGMYAPYTNKLGTTIYGYAGDQSYFNGITAVYQKLPGSNAIVYELGQILPVNPLTIDQIIAADSSLTLFAEAVKQTNTPLSPATGWNTVFAPVDSAFVAAGFPDIASIDNADKSTLSGILQYHIVPGQFFTDSLSTLTGVVASNADTIHISFDLSVLTLFGSDSSKTAGIVTGNRAASNIVLHSINRVLMP